MSSQDDIFQPEITGPRPKGGYDSPAPAGSQKLPERIMHTPGPWEIKLWPTSIDGEAFKIHSTGILLATTRSFIAGSSQGETIEANARLIAAAPELLAELKKWLEWAKDEGVQGIESTKALIAKAEGK